MTRTQLYMVFFLFAVVLILGAAQDGCFLAAAHAADWPQFQCNAARTGWTPDSPAPPFKVAYTVDFRPERCGLVQAVICKDVLYVPTMQGRLYAIDPANGERLHVTEGLGTILRSAACADGMVYVANMEGHVHAVPAAGGAPAWTAELGYAISATPCAHQGKVFIGTRRGEFFCLDGKSGAVDWKTRLGGYVWSSAAAEGERVFVATDREMKLNCLDAKSGRILWKSAKMNGVFVRDFSPVVASGKVWLYTCHYEYTYPTTFAPYTSWEADPCPIYHKYWPELHAGRLPKEFEKANEEMARELAGQPAKRTMYCFDVATGNEPFVPQGFKFHAGWLMAHAPAPVDAEGRLCVPVWFSGARIGRMDPATGRIADIIVGDPQKWLGYYSRDRNIEGWSGNTDEAFPMTCGGSRIYWKHMCMRGFHSLGFDLKTREAFQLPGGPHVKGAISKQVSVLAEQLSGKEFRYISELCMTEDAAAYEGGHFWITDNSRGDSYCGAAIWKNMLFSMSFMQDKGKWTELVAMQGLGEDGKEKEQ